VPVADNAMTHAARKSKVSHRHDRPMPFTEKHHNTAGQKALSWKTLTLNLPLMAAF
jgi:hypothetical protein